MTDPRDKGTPTSRDGAPVRLTALAGTPQTAAAAQPGAPPSGARKPGSPGVTLDDPVSPLGPNRARPAQSGRTSDARASRAGGAEGREQASFGRRLLAPSSIVTGIVFFALGSGVALLLDERVLGGAASSPRNGSPAHPATTGKPHPTPRKP
jgi:hypothetical protein